ncbi:hypothetical protein VTK73DRAFT_8581 [Phialemonium thermophilum]|uniref:EKC/KEOPS complex subunit BUD32 n=1 Tax=Phialemonium thermophilum TaxID=223376 RepID=A0ABR3W8D7_9PEZI
MGPRLRKQENIVRLKVVADWETMRLGIATHPCEGSLEHPQEFLDSFKGLCHRDVRPANILYAEKGTAPGTQPVFKLADFGLACHHMQAIEICGTAPYMAPELHATQVCYPQTPKTDVWSLGAVMLCLHPQVDFPPNAGSRFERSSYVGTDLASRSAVPQLEPMRLASSFLPQNPPFPSFLSPSPDWPLSPPFRRFRPSISEILDSTQN